MKVEQHIAGKLLSIKGPAKPGSSIAGPSHNLNAHCSKNIQGVRFGALTGLDRLIH